MKGIKRCYEYHCEIPSTRLLRACPSCNKLAAEIWDEILGLWSLNLMSWQCWWIDEILKVSWVTLWSSFWVQSTGFTMCFSTSCIPELYHSVYFSTVFMNCIFQCISQLYRSTVFQNKQRSKWSWCKLVSAVNGLDNDALSGTALIFLKSKCIQGSG